MAGNPTDRIIISDLRARCIIGVNDDERREPQDVVINIRLHCDTRAPGISDRFVDAVDYRSLKKRVVEKTESSRHFLVEALAEEIAAICLADPRIPAVTVRVEKPSALRFARSVGVQIERWQKEEDGT